MFFAIIVFSSFQSENSDYLNLSDCIQPTQAVDTDIGKTKTLEMKTPSAPKAGGILATESDEEIGNDKGYQQTLNRQNFKQGKKDSKL